MKTVDIRYYSCIHTRLKIKIIIQELSFSSGKKEYYQFGKEKQLSEDMFNGSFDILEEIVL